METKNTDFKLILFSILVLSLTACTRGYLYTNITTPLDRNMNETPIGNQKSILSTHHLKEPITGYNVSAEWQSRAIGDAAKRSNIEEIYYADLKTLSILGGIYKKQSIIIYGNNNNSFN